VLHPVSDVEKQTFVEFDRERLGGEPFGDLIQRFIREQSCLQDLADPPVGIVVKHVRPIDVWFVKNNLVAFGFIVAGGQK
jgi:hypothetical protein